MNGAISIRTRIGDDFEPSSRLNRAADSIAITEIGPGFEVITYSAAEARRYAAAFELAAQLLERQTASAS